MKSPSGVRETKTIASAAGTKTVTDAWVSGTLVAERRQDSTGAAEYRYLYGPDSLPLELRVRKDGGAWESFAIACDAAGSVTAITDSTGVTVARYAYDPWGEQIPEATSSSDSLVASQPLRYRGYYLDAESSLYYLPARYYDPALGRFLSVDPAPPHASSPTTLNRYVYAACSPAIFEDPDGTDILYGDYYPEINDQYEPDIPQYNGRGTGDNGFRDSSGKKNAPSTGSKQRKAKAARAAAAKAARDRAIEAAIVRDSWRPTRPDDSDRGIAGAAVVAEVAGAMVGGLPGVLVGSFISLVIDGTYVSVHTMPERTAGRHSKADVALGFAGVIPYAGLVATFYAHAPYAYEQWTGKEARVLGSPVYVK